jgi:hypothetical protein
MRKTNHKSPFLTLSAAQTVRTMNMFGTAIFTISATAVYIQTGILPCFALSSSSSNLIQEWSFMFLVETKDARLSYKNALA